MYDANTSAGQIARQQARDAMRSYEVRRKEHHGIDTIITETDSMNHKPDKHHEAVVDGIVHSAGTGNDEGVFMLSSFLECRARFKTEATMLSYGTQLIDRDKLERGRDIAEMMATEFWCLFVMTKDIPKRYHVFAVSDRDGNWLLDFETRDTWCRKTINSSEKVLKPCSFLNIDDAHKYVI